MFVLKRAWALGTKKKVVFLCSLHSKTIHNGCGVGFVIIVLDNFNVQQHISSIRIQNHLQVQEQLKSNAGTNKNFPVFFLKTTW